MTVIQFPGTEAPVRDHDVVVSGVRIAVHEWGKETDEPLFLVHGGSDFGRTFDEFAPRLARRGWRVITWDQRGHGDSEHAALYGWDSDIRDAIGVMGHITSKPAIVLGHSKGAAQMVQLADAQPFRFSHLINLDGLPFKRPMADVAEHERTRMVATDLSSWLDHRRTTATGQRRAGTIEELASRRGRMNPHLSIEWLRYLVTVGAREDSDGWRWKLDPAIRFGGFGPWRPEWTVTRLPGLGMPFLGVLASNDEPMGWGTQYDQIAHLLPRGGRLVVLPDTGHFLHIERPAVIEDLVVDFLAATA